MWLSCGAALLVALSPRAAKADQTLTFDGTLTEGGLDHAFIDFEVPAGTQEIQIDHDDLSADDILDWGLDDPDGFRGWGGGNTEPAIVGALAASRSYLAGPMPAGTWRVVIGKAQIAGGSADYHVVVTLRDAPTLAPQSERAPYVAPAPLSKERRWYAGDLHAHSRESGDADPTLDDLATFARSQGLDFVEFSDHNTVSQLDFLGAVQKKHPELLLVPGVEFTTYDGHANGIGATRWVDHKIGQPGIDIAGAAAQFREQGALFSINHPLLDIGDLCIGCAWKHELPADAIDAVEIATAGSASLLGNLTIDFWDTLCDTGRHVAPVGGSDDHSAGQKGGAFSTPVGTPATFVLADGLSVESILDGIRNSRTVVKVGGASGPMIELTSDVAPEGDTIHAERITLHAKITGAAGLAMRWVKNGKTLQDGDVMGDVDEMEQTVDAPVSGQDRYRVEVLSGGHPVSLTGHVWLELRKATVTPPDDSEPEVKSGCACNLAEPAPFTPWAGMVGVLGAFGWIARRRRSLRV
ncbi:PHP domain protein [Minicystis rosea]|nr:PHP domain protein [Minicystis rosea]